MSCADAANSWLRVSYLEVCRIEEPRRVGQINQTFLEAIGVSEPNLALLFCGRDFNPTWIGVRLLNVLSAEAARAK
jgi:hypothetical protein